MKVKVRKRNTVLKKAFRDINDVKRGIYFYTFLKFFCTHNDISPFDMFAENRFDCYKHTSYKTIDDAAKQLKIWKSELEKMIPELLSEWSPEFKEEKLKPLKLAGFDFNGNLWTELDKLDWTDYQFDEKEYNEVDIPIVLNDVLDSIFRILNFPEGEYSVICYNFSGYKISVKDEATADILCELIDNVSVWHGTRFLWNT